jgi:hypothetical protein
MGTDIDALVCGNAYLEKSAQDRSRAEDYKDKYELD